MKTTNSTALSSQRRDKGNHQRDYGSTTTADDGSPDQTPRISHVYQKLDAPSPAAPLLRHSHSAEGLTDDDDDDSIRMGWSRFRHRKKSFESTSSLDSLGSSLSALGSLQESLRSVVVDHAFVLSGKASSVRDVGGTATVSNEVLNLIKNLVGAGALGLPSGVAAFGNSPDALVPATVVIFIMGSIFGYYFWLMGRICHITGTASYREAWEATMMGVDQDNNIMAGGSIVALFIILMAGLGNLAYSMILADTTRSLLITAGWTGITRTQSLVGVTVLVLFPLCLVKQLTVLAPFSFVGLAGMIFTVAVMAIRYYDGTYDMDSGGQYLKDISDEFQPSFGTIGAKGALSVDFLLLVCMTFQAFFAHYNAPRYYIELADNTVKRFGTVVSSAFGISAAIYVIMTAFGFLTFGSNADGFILNNYATSDELASLCRLAIAVALAFTYPLPFIGVRDAILDLLEVPPQKHTSSNLNVLTVILLVIFTGLAMRFTDLGMVNAVGGGALGTAVVFIFPALMFRSAVTNLGIHASIRQRREAVFAIALMWIGIAMGSIGVWVALAM